LAGIIFCSVLSYPLKVVAINEEGVLIIGEPGPVEATFCNTKDQLFSVLHAYNKGGNEQANKKIKEMSIGNISFCGRDELYASVQESQPTDIRVNGEKGVVVRAYITGYVRDTPHGWYVKQTPRVELWFWATYEVMTREQFEKRRLEREA